VPAVSRIVSALDDLALITRTRPASDARARLVSLRRPRDLLDAWLPVWRQRRLRRLTWDIGATMNTLANKIVSMGSVTPFVSWEDNDDGPTFVGAPMRPYRLSGNVDVRVPQPDGALIELPMSIGYSRPPSMPWTGLHRLLSTRLLRRLRLRGVAARLGLLKRISLSPETDSVADMLTLTRRLLDAGIGHLHLFFHSPSLRPGLSEFNPDAESVEGMYRAIASYVEGAGRMTALRFVTVSEAAMLLSEVALVRASQFSGGFRQPVPLRDA
jgi:hypothetical protein